MNGDEASEGVVDFRFDGLAKNLVVNGRFFVKIDTLMLTIEPVGRVIGSYLVGRQLNRRHPGLAMEVAHDLRRINAPLFRSEFRDVGDVVHSWVFACESIKRLRKEDAKNAERVRVLEYRIQEQREQMQRMSIRHGSSSRSAYTA